MSPRTIMAFLVAVACAAGGCDTLGKKHQAAWVRQDTTYLHTGFSAGPALLTRADGSVVEERRYEPFGAPLDGADFVAEPTNGLNKPTDPATGLSYHGARWMAPLTARWLSPDPPVKAPDPKFMAAPWNLHPYQYVTQNPVAYWDPDGQLPRWLEMLFSRPGPSAGEYGMHAWDSALATAVTEDPTLRFMADHPVATVAIGATVVGAVLAAGEALPIAGALASDASLSAGAYIQATWPWAIPLGTGALEAWSGQPSPPVARAEVEVAERAGPILLNPGINITEKGMQHVVDRHTLSGIAKWAGKSKFNAGEDLVKLIESGTQMPMVLQKNGNFARVWDIGRLIGLDRTTGQQSSWVTIITKGCGDLVTCFPGKP